MIRFSSLLLAATLAGAAIPAIAATRAADSGEAKLASLLADRIPGKPVDCINLQNARSSQVIDRTAIVYDAGSTLYVNRPQSGADSLRRDDILVTRSYSSQLCSIDIVRLVDQGSHFEHGFVGLGQFIPYTKVKPAR